MNQPLQLTLKRSEMMALQLFLSRNSNHTPVDIKERLPVVIARTYALHICNKLVLKPHQLNFKVSLNESVQLALWNMLTTYDYGHTHYDNIVLNNLLTSLDQHLS